MRITVHSSQHSAVSHQPNLFTAKDAKDAKEEVSSGFPITFATFAPVAVELFG
jgi:hypothetical protein